MTLTAHTLVPLFSSSNFCCRCFNCCSGAPFCFAESFGSCRDVLVPVWPAGASDRRLYADQGARGKKKVWPAGASPRECLSANLCLRVYRSGFRRGETSLLSCALQSITKASQQELMCTLLLAVSFAWHGGVAERRSLHAASVLSSCSCSSLLQRVCDPPTQWSFAYLGEGGAA